MTIEVNHVLSSASLRSTIFDHLIARIGTAAGDDLRISASVRPTTAAVHHYHRPNLERRLLPRSVVTVHHDLRETLKWLRLARFLPRYREAARVVCLNRTQQAILAHNGIAHTTLVPHGVDRKVFPVPEAARRPRQGRMVLGLFSRRYERGVKGEDLLDGLFAGLDPARVEFLFVGEGRHADAHAARCRGFAATSYEAPPYRLFGALYASIDALLILSHSEGGPACLPEALGSGIPVFATPVGICPDWIRDGVNGLLLDRDARLAAARIMALCDGDGLANLMTGAFASAAEVPSWDDVVGAHRRIYLELAGAC